MPQGFSKEEGRAKIMVWTSLAAREKSENISAGFSASYADGAVTFAGLPAICGKCTVAVYNEGTKDSELSDDISNKFRYVSQFSSSVSGVNLDLTSGTYIISVGGRNSSGEYLVCKTEFTVE